MWLSVVVWEINIFYYLNFLQDITKYQRTIANIVKDFSQDVEPIELLRVTYAHFLELLVEKKNELFQGVFIFLSKQLLG